VAQTRPGTRQVLCKQCLAVAEIADGTDPHSLTWCACCTITGDDGQPHHHGASVMEAEACAAANHPGQPCWNPPGQPVKPDGCTICRPVVHFAVAGEIQLAV
jgi:hypothetical protein